MAELTQDEQALFEKLKAKMEAPDPPANGGRREEVSVLIDLSDEKAVERGLSLGWLKPADLGGGDDDDGKGDDGNGKGGKGKGKGDPDDGGPPPNRGGYFRDS